MKYTWYELERLTPDALSKLLGVEVLSVNMGETHYGEPINETDPEGNPITRFNYRKGVVVETKEELTGEQLKILDAFFVGMQRFGAQSIIIELEELKTQLSVQASKITTLEGELKILK